MTTLMAADPPPSQISVLIVDQHPADREFLLKILRSAEGWTSRIDCASSAEDALRLLGERFYDLIFVDFNLPGSNGLEALEKIRQLHSKSAVVMITSEGNELLAVSAMKKGAMDYLTHEELGKMDVRQLFRRLIEVRKLANQNMELRQINEMKNEFIANVSHELRTPLTVILGFAKKIEQGQLGPVTEDQRKALLSILDRSENLLQTLNHILKVGQASRDEIKVPLRPLNLQAWAAAFAQKPHKGLDRKRQRLEASVPKEAVWVLASQERFEEAMDNIMSNAVKFGPPESRILLTVSPSAPNMKDHALLSVQDEGPGIPPELLPHIFEQFFAAGQGPTREYPGLGLGLPLAKQILETHAGTVWVESKGVGMGCTAFVTVPRCAPDTPEVLVGQQVAPIQKKRILIVEDNPDLVEILRLFMSSISPNLEIFSAASGFEALRHIGEKTPNLIILDIMMPDMNGLELIERLRRLPDFTRIAVLVLTGYSEAAQMALKIGAKDVLMKPFEKNLFVKKVMRLLEESAPVPRV